MARTIVITGGTNGIGRALARHYTERGDHVVAVGGSREGGRRLREAAPQARFVRADLSSLRRTRALIERLATEYPVIDALVLAAFRFNPVRVETEEGVEHTFALYVLNRWLMAEGLREPLERAPAPVIVNLCGAGQGGRVHWDDLQLKDNYRGLTATLQGAAASELLGTAYLSGRTRYVLYNPVFVATGLHEPFRQPLRGLMRVASAVFAQPVARAVPPIAALIDHPPAEPLTAWKKGKPLPLAVDRDQARRFAEILRTVTRSALP
ncbi:SDR family NAD(P)-dependent oxidoreductase [Nonomuraea endophytica]|uniref:NAD(P)-dependent dehydrogenase (Short-subunit alcohol dehydrogenase family) n=1 Tax=Nonomuraea endophytica TaxID=714136 RepID=A0A7W8A8N8_9ACTN|nr:SDR family NAD(P)-dependent oxidoreductase [Nonomuraea endophytica]MBB5081661.1 NAD(P)-dependent dehydrogenase (short-subunit alcohol dehydrogenase family) [Nonomuraea endophytica]